MFQANTLPLTIRSAFNAQNTTFWDAPNNSAVLNNQPTNQAMTTQRPTSLLNSRFQNFSASATPIDLAATSNSSSLPANNLGTNPNNMFYSSMPLTSQPTARPVMNYNYSPISSPMAGGAGGYYGSMNNNYNYSQFPSQMLGGGGYYSPYSGGYSSPAYGYGNIPMMNYGGYSPYVNYNTRPVMPYPSFNMMPPMGNNLNYSFFNPGLTLKDNADGFTDPSILSGGYDRGVKNGYIHGINRVLLPSNLPKTNTGGSPPVQQPPATRTIADLLGPANSGYDNNAYDFDILRNLLTSSGLLNTVNDAKDATLFAPVDGAFYQLARDVGVQTNGYNEQEIVTKLNEALTKAGNGNATPLLQDILKYHVSGSRLSVNDISKATTIPTLLQGKSLGVVKPQIPVRPAY